MNENDYILYFILYVMWYLHTQKKKKLSNRCLELVCWFLFLWSSYKKDFGSIDDCNSIILNWSLESINFIDLWNMERKKTQQTNKRMNE